MGDSGERDSWDRRPQVRLDDLEERTYGQRAEADLKYAARRQDPSQIERLRPVRVAPEREQKAHPVGTRTAGDERQDAAGARVEPLDVVDSDDDGLGLSEDAKP